MSHVLCPFNRQIWCCDVCYAGLVEGLIWAVGWQFFVYFAVFLRIPLHLLVQAKMKTL